MLFFTTYGDPSSRPILFIHGISLSSNVWLKQASSSMLLKNHFLITVDLPMHGCSDKAHVSYNDSFSIANALNDLLQYLQVEDIIVCAWSYGAIVLCDYIRHFGTSKIKGINFISGFFNNGTPDDEFACTDKFLSVLENYISDDLSEVTEASREFVKMLSWDALLAIDFDRFLADCMKCPIDIRKEMLFRNICNRVLLKNLNTPVLFTHGMCDEIIKPISSLQLLSNKKYVSKSFYDNVGHMPFWEAQLRYEKELLEFSEYCFEKG